MFNMFKIVHEGAVVSIKCDPHPCLYLSDRWFDRMHH